MSNKIGGGDTYKSPLNDPPKQPHNPKKKVLDVILDVILGGRA